MSGGLEKLVRFLDALKLSQSNAASGESESTTPVAATASSAGGRSFSAEQFLEQTAAVASLASTITQQGQTLIRSEYFLYIMHQDYKLLWLIFYKKYIYFFLIAYCKFKLVFLFPL